MTFQTLKFFLIPIVVLSIAYSDAKGDVFVSKTMHFPLIKNEYHKIKAKDFWASSPIPLSADDEIDLSVSVVNKTWKDLNVYICDKADLRLYLNDQSHNCSGVNRGKKEINYTFRAQTKGQYQIILDNSFAKIIKKKVYLSASIKTSLSDKTRKEIATGFSNIMDKLNGTFINADIRLNISPCGTANAFSENSTGNITLCSELVFELFRQNIPGALVSIFAHELGHSLPNRWGLPNYDNEESADEFALALLYFTNAQEKAIGWVDYFENKNVYAEAQHMIRNGSRHPLSSQRIRNIRRILQNPNETITRWHRIFHENMTIAGLKEVIQKPNQFTDIKYVKKLLGQREREHALTK